MDWPVIGAVSAVVIVAGAVTFEVVVFLQSDPAPVKRAPQPAGYVTSVERSAYEIPGFATGKPAEWTPSFPLIPLIDPERIPPAENQIRADHPPARETARKPSSASIKPPP